MALIAQYKMNSNGNDSSGNNKNGVVGGGVSWDTLNSLIGSVSALFSGISTSKINLPFGNGYNFTLQDLTISLWVKSTFTDNSKKIIISSGISANASVEVGQKDGYWFIETRRSWLEGVTPNEAAAYYGAVYGLNKFVAVRDFSIYNKRVSYSLDGKTWVAGIIESSENTAWGGVTYGLGIYVAAGSGTASPNHFMWSADGITWKIVNGGISQSGWSSICFGLNKFVAVGTPGSGGLDNQRACYSTDGINWTLTTTPNALSTTYWYCVNFGNDIFIAVGKAADRTKQAMRSVNGVDWEILTTPNVNCDFYKVVYGNGVWVAVGNSLTDETIQIMYSTDNGETWHITNSGVPTAMTTWYSSAFGNGMFVVGSIYTSGAELLLYSYNGIDWYSFTTPDADIDYRCIAFGNNTWVALGGNASDRTKSAIYMTVDTIGNIIASTNKTHIGIVFDSVNLEIRLYVDGILSSTISFSTLTLDTDFVIGTNANAQYGFWEGLIDDIKIYDAVFTQDDLLRIKQLSASINKNKKLYASEFNEVDYLDKVFPNDKKSFIADEFCEIESGAPYTGNTKITKTGKVYCTEFIEN